MNSVAPRSRANRDHRIAHALGLCANEVILVHEPHAHRVDERIAFVCRIEDDLTRDGRNPDAVPVVPNSLDDATKQVANARAIE